MELLDKIDIYLNEMVLNNLFGHIPKKYLSKRKIKTSERNKINKQIQKFLKPIYFSDIPLDGIFDILDKFGIKAIQEDNTEWSGFLMGGSKQTEMVHFNLGWKDEYERVSGKKVYMAIQNAVMTMTYYKMPSGKFEIIAYI